MSFGSPRDARRNGIGMVHQHFTSIEALTVRENLELALGRRLERDYRWSDPLLVGMDPAQRVERLGVAARQRLEIARALGAGGKILLLDEPGALLTPSEIDELLALVREFAARGGSAVFVTHKLSEVFAAADRVTVLRRGIVRLESAVADQTPDTLAAAMIGEPLSRPRPPSPRPPEQRDPIVAVRIGGLSIRAGELVGIAAIEGNGQRDLLRRIAGLPRQSLDDPGASEPAVWAGGTVGFVPEDRTTEGLIPGMSVSENLLLGRDSHPGYRRGPWLDWNAIQTHGAEVLREYQVVAEGPTAPAATLSGGNQQKLLLARALESRPAVLVAENPVRGLDLRASADILERLRQAARAGIAVLVYSTDLDEVLGLAERILVVRDREITEAPAGADRRVIGVLMLGLPGRAE